MKFLATNKDNLEHIQLNCKYALVGFSTNEQRLELTKDKNRESIFHTRMKNNLIQIPEFGIMLKHVANIIKRKDIEYIVCYSDDNSMSLALADILSDAFKIPRELKIVDDTYKKYYSYLYKLAVDEKYLKPM